MSKSFLSLLESGKREPSLSALNKIAAALNVPLNILILLSSRDDELQGMSPDLVHRLKDLSVELLEPETETSRV